MSAINKVTIISQNKEAIWLNMQDTKAKSADIEIYNNEGVFTRKEKIHSINGSFKIDVSNIPVGKHWFCIKVEDKERINLPFWME